MATHIGDSILHEPIGAFYYIDNNPDKLGQKCKCGNIHPLSPDQNNQVDVTKGYTESRRDFVELMVCEQTSQVIPTFG